MCASISTGWYGHLAAAAAADYAITSYDIILYVPYIPGRNAPLLTDFGSNR